MAIMIISFMFLGAPSGCGVFQDVTSAETDSQTISDAEENLLVVGFSLLGRE